MTHLKKWLNNRQERHKQHFLLIFSILLVAATGAFFILMFPEKSYKLVRKVYSLANARPHTPQLTAIPLPDPMNLDGNKALEETSNFLAVGERYAGTDGAERAAKYIAARLKDIGIEPFIDEFTNMTPAGERTFRNVIGEIRGPKDSIIILLSHYDTKSGVSRNFQGANDSGSSTGLLLEIARVLKQHKPGGATILFAFLDGEECMKEYGPQDGLHGSRRLVQTLIINSRVPKVTAVILLDMVGDSDLNIGIPANSSRSLASLVFESAREESVRDKFSLSGNYILDDHVPFLQAGIHAIDIIDFDYGSQPGKNDYWHTEKDTIDKLSAVSLQTVGRVVIRTVNKLRDASPPVITRTLK